MNPHDIDVSDKCSAIRLTNLGGEDPCNSNPRVPCRHLGWLRFYTGVNASWQKLSALPYADGSDTVFEGEPLPHVLGLENTLSISLSSINNSPAHAQFRVELSPNLEFEDGSHSLIDTITSPEQKPFKFRRLSTSNCPASISPIVKIYDQNNGGKDITNAPQSISVGVGEKIALSSECIAPKGTRPVQYFQLLGKSVAGGFIVVHVEPRDGKPGIDTGDVEKPKFTPTTAEFYWVEAGKRQLVEAVCSLNNGRSVKADVIYDVDGPKDVTVDAELGKVQIVMVRPSKENGRTIAGPGMGLYNMPRKVLPGLVLPGYPSKQPGFWGPPKPSYKNNPTGKLIWGQLVDIDQQVLKDVEGKVTMCSNGTGLDNEFPYPLKPEFAPTISDSPEVPLIKEYIERSRRFKARSYLMWKPTKEDSIPVPLGVIAWEWSGKAKRNPLPSNVNDVSGWTLREGFQAMQGYRNTNQFPIWKSRNINGPCLSVAERGQR